MNFSERVRNLEKKLQSEEMPNFIIEVLGDGMIEVYADKEGERIRMTEEEYDTWTKRYQKKPEPMDITVQIGEWDPED